VSSRILDLEVDEESPEGVVYIKTASPQDAGQVFQ
jgi:hypothetical protein